MMLAAPFPGREAAPPSEADLEADGESFMAAMSQFKAGA